MDHLDVVRRESDRVEQFVRAAPDLDAPVPSCGDWTSYDLVTHLGGVHRWAAAATRVPPDGRVPGVEEPQGLDAAALADWFAEGAATLVEALSGDPDQPCWTLAEPRTVASWLRRQAHETTVHRWDLESALGLPAVIDPEVAVDGVDEVLSVMLPRQVRLGRARVSSRWVRLVVDGREVPLATGPDRDPAPVATVRGGASEVLLLLWGRGGAGLSVEGAADALTDFLRGAVTP